MKCKNIAFFEWILLFTISQGSCFTVLQFKNLSEKRVTELLNAVKDTKHDKDFQNSVSDVSKHFAGKNVEGSRRSSNDFMYKKLVKRIIPHGYKVNDFEYDDKFKTLFKPLVRIHKVKPDPDNSSDDEDRFDLVYILDDEHFKDKPQTNDDDFLKPFTLDNLDIKHLPADNGIEYVIDRNEKLDDSRPNNQLNELGQSELDTDQIDIQKILSNTFNFYIDDDRLKQILGPQNGQWTRNDQDPAKSKHIFELLNKSFKSTINKNKPKVDPEKPHRYISIGLLSSEQLKPELNNGIQRRQLERNTANLYKLKSSNINQNNVNNIDILELLELIAQNQNKLNVDPIEWFVPIGVKNSKQSTITDNRNNIIQPKVNKHEPENHNNLLDSLIQIENQQSSNEDQSINSKSIQDYVQDLFQSKDNSNHKTHDHSLEREPVPIYIIKPKKAQEDKTKETKPKNPLLDKIAQLKASYDYDRTKRLKETLNILKELRSSQKSGEIDEEPTKVLTNLDFIDGPTTAKPKRYHPQIPLWNEWTYDRQIVEDDCKGQLVQHGRVCISAWA